jgi:16S rRNA (guanine966-N2)-methyltransferase
MFASLGAEVEGARCLDLFAGTGAVGIEALSRGASHCTFVERSRAATAVIRSNLATTGLGDRATVRTADASRWLRRRPSDVPAVQLAFLDPPYSIELPTLERCLLALDEAWLDPQRWTVVVTRGQKGSLPAVPVHWAARRQLRYGDSLLVFYREVRWA